MMMHGNGQQNDFWLEDTERGVNMKKKISKQVVKHFIGHDPQDWITDCMYRLMNKKISVSDLRKEAKAMYKSYTKR